MHFPNLFLDNNGVVVVPLFHTISYLNYLGWAFNWKHERDALTTIAEKKKISYAVIDGETPANKRTGIVQRFQAGQIQGI